MPQKEPDLINPDLINLADRIPGMVYRSLTDKRRTITLRIYQ